MNETQKNSTRDGLYYICSDIDDQQTQISLTRAVLRAVMSRTESNIEPDSTQAYIFVQDLEYINNLLIVVDRMLFSAEEELINISDALLDAYKKESAPAVTATETQENQEPKPLHTCDNDIIQGAALSNEIGGKA